MNDFEDLFMASHIAQAMLDGNLIFKEVNQAFCSMLGVARDDIIGLYLRDLKDRSLVTYVSDSGETIADAINGKRVTHGQSSIQTKAGSFVIKRTNQPRINSKGVVDMVFVTYDDITALVKKQEYTAKEVKQLAEAYKEAAEGNLRVRYKITDPDNDTRDAFEELVILRDVVDGIVGNLRESIKIIFSEMYEVSEVVISSATSITELSNAVDGLARDLGAVSNGIQGAGKSSEEIQRVMADMNIAITNLANDTSLISGESEDVKESSDKGLGLTLDTKKLTEEIANAATKMVDDINRNVQQMGDVDSLVRTIDDVARQTNLLALNAAIEAARAGDAGKGFAVVAAEVKSLSQDSKKSAESIRGIVEELSKSISAVSKNMVQAAMVVKQGNDLASKSHQTFNGIVEKIEGMNGKISNMASSTQEQAAVVEEITASVHEISNLVVSAGQGANNIAAATEEVAASIDNISKNMEKVSGSVRKVQELMGKFKV
ncbi:methyl-accepting chemotaxis protein [bacterium]|nr:methyl-accepting chemotaxis protein [bacterium]